jgi:hypothetical protein
MLESAWLFIGVTALLTTGGAVLTNDDALAIVMGGLGFINWGLVAYGAFDVRTVSSGVTIQFTMAPVALFAVVMSLLPLYIALTGPLALVNRNRDDADSTERV